MPLITLAAGLIFPLFVLFQMGPTRAQAAEKPADDSSGDTAPVISQTAQPVAGTTDGVTIAVYFHEEDEIREVALEEYLVGVVAAEMPAAYHEEALKAQAVAARSYILNKQTELEKNPDRDNGHMGAVVCTNYAHCKAWCSDEECREKWGDSFVKYYTKIASAVAATSGEVMLYDSQPICAVFHAMSSGMTEDSENVWGGELPYLRSVESPGDLEADNFITTVTVPDKELKAKLMEADLGIDFSGHPSEWVTMVNLTDAGNVDTVKIGGVLVPGKKFRSLFSLRSTSFSLSYNSDDKLFTFTVKGYGHDVGMSQTGANYYAKNGMSYRDILTHYYTGVEFGKR